MGRVVSPMATISTSFLRSSFTFPQSLSSTTITSRPSHSQARFSRSPVAMDSGDDLRSKFMEFPYVSRPHKDLMVELLSSVEARLGSSLGRCTMPSNVQQFGNTTGSARASLNVRSGLPSSQIDFVLAGWIHCQLPSSMAINTTTLALYLKSSTDAPHFLLEIIQSGPTSLILILDLTPRKDLILYPDYLKKYYGDTNLDKHRAHIQSLPEAQPYISPNLFIRALLSPTAICVNMDAEGGEKRSIEDVIRDHVGPAAREMLDFWIGSCSCVGRSVGEEERGCLVKRDGVIKRTTVEVDLESSFLRLFGQEVADRVLGVLRGYYGA